MGVAAHAQTLEDGIMLARGTLCAGSIYTRSQWSQYWEGTLERTNGNIGTVTTNSVSGMANYGITNRINVLAQTPYIWTQASAGVLHPQSGFQDFTGAVKLNLFQRPMDNHGSFHAIALLGGSVPTTDYSPDQMPLSIGTHSKSAFGRASLNFLGRRGLYLDGSLAYTLRDKVTLDRPYYYTNGQLYLSNQVAMPNQSQYGFNVGYYRRDLKIAGTFSQMNTRGGGDIRRQDMPFVSNRVNESRAGIEVQYPLPHFHDVQYWASYSNTFQGRNTGQATMFTSGIMFTYHRERRVAP
ncbi:transporter family protein [Terriglobus aquaticus]|uniref:MetA-pathway of phenol degradation n=2 Tax=Terriglobus aquaticus TaxID=940139 RepID=A0ABW9KNZ4_9BACT